MYQRGQPRRRPGIETRMSGVNPRWPAAPARWLGPLLACLLLWLGAGRALAAPTPVDYDVPGGHFFSQTGGNGLGFVVADWEDDTGQPARFWTAYQGAGGLAALGYPISDRFRASDGQLYQAFQAGILQWRADIRSAGLVNVYDLLSASGADQRLLAAGVPLPAPDDVPPGNAQRTFQSRLAWLTNDPIRIRYTTNPATGARWDEAHAAQLYGLPTSRPQRFGPFIAQRFQRVVLQLWVDVVPGMPAPGTVTPMLAGDLFKQFGLVPAPSAAPGPAAESVAVDPPLRPALGILAGYDAAQGSNYVQNLAQNVVSVRFGPLPAHVLGAFDPRRNGITVSDSLKGRQVDLLAEVISHESSHALDYWSKVDIFSPSGCMATELTAFRHQAEVWNYLHPGGKPNPVDRVDSMFNLVLTEVATNPAGFADRLSRIYKHECGG